MNLIAGPVTINLCTQYSFRWVMFIGGIVFSTGFFLSAFISHIEHMFITYGFISGKGMRLNTGML